MKERWSSFIRESKVKEVLYITDILVDKISAEDQKSISAKYDKDEKAKVLSYLKKFEVASFTSAPVVDAFTNEIVAVADNGYTDGKYTWYESEVYYFEEYDLKLDKDFIEYIKKAS